MAQEISIECVKTPRRMTSHKGNVISYYKQELITPGHDKKSKTKKEIYKATILILFFFNTFVYLNILKL